MTEFLASPLFSWVVLPLVIVVARVLDVSLGTLRVIFITRGHLVLAPALGFLEVLIWLSVISQILQRTTGPLYFVAYAAGYSLGTFVGLMIERRLALGMVLVRIITRREAHPLIEAILGAGFGITYLDARGATGPAQLIFTLVKRQEAPRVVELVHQHNPNAFYTIEDIRFVRDAALVRPAAASSSLTARAGRFLAPKRR